MDRGRDAARPRAIPTAGWKDIAFRIKDQIAEDHVGLIAAGVAFYGLLALFPAITAAMAIAGLLTEPSQLVDQLDRFAAVMPRQAADIVIGQATEVAGSSEGGLGLAVVLGLLLALYSASRGVASLIEGMNVAYDETETRGMIRLYLLTYGLTVFLIVGFLLGIAVTMVMPALLSFLTLGTAAEWIARGASWLLLLALTSFGLAVLYRVGPCRESARWRWITSGAVIATLLWLLGSIAFGLYVGNFGSYNETFGALGGVIVLLMWLWLSAYIVLIGAEIDSEIEAQTRVDSTTGPSRPMGERGAVKADEVGEARG